MALVGNERIGLKHSFEPLYGIAGLVPDCGKMCEVPRDLTFVPGGQDRLDIREVLVQRRTSDAGLLGYLRHRHRQQPMFGHERRSGVQGRFAHRAAMRLDRVVPKLRHHLSIRHIVAVSRCDTT